MRSQLLLPFSAFALLASGCGDDATTTESTDTGSSSSSEGGSLTEQPGTTVTPTTTDASTGPAATTTTGGTTTPGDDSTSSGETADTTTGGSSSETGDPIENNCVSDPDLCGAGTVCDPGSLTCVADCSADAALCGPGTVCMAGMCKPDCSGDPAACGAGTVCGPDLVCVVDCRSNLLDVCAGEGLCNRGTGVCEAVAAYDCAAAPGLCWEDQTCGSDGFCRAAAVDLELAYDVQHYDLRLDLLTLEQAFAAEVAISLVATQDATAEVVLDVGAETLVDGEPWQPYAVTGVVDGDGQALEFVQDGAAGSLTVTLASPLAQGDAAVLRVSYAGSFNAISDASDPLFYTGVMQRDGKNGDPYVMTFGWPVYARRWLPSQDHPRDIATFSVDVGIDNDYVVLGNGVPVRSGEVDGLQRAAFVLQQPVPTYAMHVIASEFETVRLGVVDGVPVDAVVHAAEVPLVHDLWGVAVGALALFNDRLGAYPFSRYAMISVPSAFGGMEHATIVSMADAGVVPNGQGTHRTAIHELSHHWFGDNNHQAEWPAFWLNESLASFMEIEGLRVLGGATLYRERLDIVRAAVFATPGNYNTDALHYATAQDFPGQVTTASFVAPYRKGPWIWHMLRVRLGDAAFNAAVRALYELHRFGDYSTESALTVLTDSSGEDLAQFFAEWVETPGWPQLKVTYTYDAAQQEIDVTVQQVQDAALYGTYTLEGALDLDLAFDDGDPMTPTCNVAVAFATGEVQVDATVACPVAPTSFAIPSLGDVFAELVP
jgi:aminopeptidase N